MRNIIMRCFQASLRRLILEYEAPRFTWDSLFESASSSTHSVSDNRHLPLPRSYIAYASHTWESLFELEQFTLYDSHAASDLPLRQWRNGSSSFLLHAISC
jgi:hypothetical protein